MKEGNVLQKIFKQPKARLAGIDINPFPNGAFLSLSSALMAYSSSALSAMSTWWLDWLWENTRLVFMCVRINVSGLYFGSIHGVCWNNV